MNELEKQQQQKKSHLFLGFELPISHTGLSRADQHCVHHTIKHLLHQGENLVGAWSPVSHTGLSQADQHCVHHTSSAPGWKLSWGLEPSQPQRVTSWLNTNFILGQSYSFHKYWYHKSCIKKKHIYIYIEPIYVPWVLSTGTCVQQGDLFYSAGLHRKPVLATANAGKILERFLE